MANDTTTALNPGVGGDSMDESLVTQSDGVTTAKRPRVVIGGDANTNGNDLVQPVSSNPGANSSSLPVLPQAIVNDTPESYIVGELRSLSMTPEGRLRVATTNASTYMDMFGDEAQRANSTNPDDFDYSKNSPFDDCL